MSVNDFRMYVLPPSRDPAITPRLTAPPSLRSPFHRGDQSFENFETLLRAVLSYPSKPAVIILQTFKLDGVIATGGDSQMTLAQYYDVPVISARNWILPMLMRNPDKMSKFYNYWIYEFGTGKVLEDRKDVLHPNADGHKMMADTIIMYLQQQVSPSSDHQNIHWLQVR